jgi:hypothetical protein
MTTEVNQRNATDIKLLLQIEKYKAEIVRLEGVRNGENQKRWKEYFQGHIDSLTGIITDLEKLIQ